MFCQLISFTQFTRLEKLRRSQNTHGTWHSGASSGLDQAGLAGPFFQHPFWVAKKIVGNGSLKNWFCESFYSRYVYIPNFICIYRYRCYNILCVYYNTSKDTSFVKNTSFIFAVFILFVVSSMNSDRMRTWVSSMVSCGSRLPQRAMSWDMQGGDDTELGI